MSEHPLVTERKKRRNAAARSWRRHLKAQKERAARMEANDGNRAAWDHGGGVEPG